MTAPTLYFFRRVTSNNGCRQRPPDKKDTPGKNSHSGRKHKDRLTKLTSSIRRREVISKTLRVGRQRSTGQFVVTQSHGDHPLSTTAATARRPEAAHGDQGGKLSAVQQHRHKQARSVAGPRLVEQRRQSPGVCEDGTVGSIWGGKGCVRHPYYEPQFMCRGSHKAHHQHYQRSNASS